jgi:hypothetical protein
MTPLYEPHGRFVRYSVELPDGGIEPIGVLRCVNSSVARQIASELQQLSAASLRVSLAYFQQNLREWSNWARTSDLVLEMRYCPRVHRLQREEAP